MSNFCSSSLNSFFIAIFYRCHRSMHHVGRPLKQYLLITIGKVSKVIPTTILKAKKKLRTKNKKKTNFKLIRSLSVLVSLTIGLLYYLHVIFAHCHFPKFPFHSPKSFWPRLILPRRNISSI